MASKEKIIVNTKQDIGCGLGLQDIKSKSKEEKIEIALKAIRRGMSIREAARLYGLKNTTLRHRKTREYKRTFGVLGKPTIFSMEDENRLVNQCIQMMNCGHKLWRRQILKLAKSMARAKGIVDERIAGNSWFIGFKKRHPNFKVELYKKRLEAKIRGKTSNEEIIASPSQDIKPDMCLQEIVSKEENMDDSTRVIEPDIDRGFQEIASKEKKYNNHKESIERYMDPQEIAFKEEKICKALKAIGEGMSVRGAARQFGLPGTTLRHRKLREDKTTYGIVGKPTLFSREDEDDLANICIRIANSGNGIVRWQVLKLARSMAREKGIDHVIAGGSWFRGFKRRHPNLRFRSVIKRNKEIDKLLDDTMQTYFLERAMDSLEMTSNEESISKASQANKQDMDLQEKAIKEEKIDNAFQVNRHGMSMPEAAQLYGIQNTSFRSRQLNSDKQTDGVVRKPTLFIRKDENDANENHLASENHLTNENHLANECIDMMASLGYKLTRRQVIELARNMAQEKCEDEGEGISAHNCLKKIKKRNPSFKLEYPKKRDSSNEAESEEKIKVAELARSILEEEDTGDERRPANELLRKKIKKRNPSFKLEYPKNGNLSNNAELQEKDIGDGRTLVNKRFKKIKKQSPCGKLEICKHDLSSKTESESKEKEQTESLENTSKEKRIAKALQAIENGTPMRQAGRLYQINHSSLWNRKARLGKSTYGKKGKPPLFSKEEEDGLANYITKMTRLGHGLARWQVVDVAKSMARQKGIVDFSAGINWFKGFQRRHPSMMLGPPKKRKKTEMR